MKKQTVLVTGGAGFIGSHTADLFLEKGYKVRIMDNLVSHNNKWPLYLNKKFEKIKGDVRNLKDWKKALRGVDFVIHLAALMDFHLEFSNFFLTNTVGTANLYEVIVANRLPIKKVVIASSQFVYGYGRWRCAKHGIVHPTGISDKDREKKKWDPSCPICQDPIKYIKNTESHVDPPNQYAISKYTQELIGLKLGRMHNIPTTALRYSIVHGSRQSIKNLYSGALRVFCLQLLNNQTILLFEDGKMLRDFVSVYDVARANFLVTQSKKSDYEVYNVGGGKAYSIFELSQMVAREFKKLPNYEYGSFRVGDIRHAVSDISKIKNIGWRPQIKEEKSIKDFVNWLNLHKTSKKDINAVFNKMRKSGVLKKI